MKHVMTTELSERAYQILSLMDLTRLEEHDREGEIQAFCQQLGCCKDTLSPVVYPAAVCIYPHYINTVVTTLKRLNIPLLKIATVVNFPEGKAPLSQVANDINNAITLGADEIDVVFPWQDYLHGDHVLASRFIEHCKAACPKEVLLKVILETGELKQYDSIYHASRLAIDAGADFIKTSTGKVTVNATIEAADAMLHAIKHSGSLSCGFKASGGIRTVENACDYLLLAERLMTPEWVTPQHFRFGASGLLNSVLAVLTDKQ